MLRPRPQSRSSRTQLVLRESDQVMEQLLAVIDGGEELVGATSLAHVDLPQEIAAILLKFSGRELCVAVDPDDDSLQVAATAPVDTQELESLSGSKGWSSAIGNRLLWAWRLTNHQGYDDGIQLAFCEASGGVETVVLQLIGKASTIEVGIVVRV